MQNVESAWWPRIGGSLSRSAAATPPRAQGNGFDAAMLRASGRASADGVRPGGLMAVGQIVRSLLLLWQAVRFPLLLGAAIIASACEPATHLDGRVTEHDGHPLANVVVRTACPNASGAMSATSDASGNFSVEGFGCIRDECRLEVSRPGHVTKVFPIKPYCTGTVLGCRAACSTMRAELVLE
ncbi:carboxypeptidase-like regulatory domain-containing protein [Sorangium sp. So ce1000]|uniref:carboxypeptidase-like regulatory domain-containing protein n=1 Tax=Sorangium sp. So ce1000 TaxID=3133325 RepID=UPI003F644AE2